MNINTQMSTTGLQSDIVLPAAGFYEKEGMFVRVNATSSDAVIAAIKAKLGK